MKNVRIVFTVVLALFSLSALAFPSNAERVDSYIELLKSGSTEAQVQMLNRLQWSGLSESTLFDVIEQRLLEHYKQENLSNDQIGLFSHHVRALGYSGNEKYRSTIAEVSQNADDSKVKKHAKKALTDLTRFGKWLALLPSEPVAEQGESIESATYLMMLESDNVFVQRLAARAIFHEQNGNPRLLAKATELIEATYMNAGIDGETEDTVAWLCKAIGVAGNENHKALLLKIAEQTPSKKISKYAKKYSS